MFTFTFHISWRLRVPTLHYKYFYIDPKISELKHLLILLFMYVCYLCILVNLQLGRTVSNTLL